ncbi:MAG TPA: IS66 family insertion sequence element accessory protein TnpB [Gemmatimonadaceae bacterium]|nr:IS66 family insertion sequence element accessory protein TnpB [Gemmatimonadaceae bacterium]
MIGIPQSVRILIGSTPIDMRKSIDGLMAIVQEEMGEDAYSGHLFVFVSRRCDRVKILAWDKGGFVLVYKRLEKGQFKLPHMDPSTMAVEIDATQLAMLLDGIDFGRVRRPNHWRPPSQMDRAGSRPMDKATSP